MTKNHTVNRTSFSTANENISVPIGTIGFVTEYLGKLGLGPVFARIKRKGIPLNSLMHALISYRLTENFSIEGCGRWLQNPIVSREFGIPGKVSSRMLNRAVETVGKHMEEIVSASAFFLTKHYNLPHTDCNIDASSLSVYSRQSDLFSFGYSRDKRFDLRQVNFAVAEISSPVNLPIGLTVSPGNTPDGKQFIELLENIRPHLRENSTVVMDAAGDNKNVTDKLAEMKLNHVVRKKMNVSDDKLIENFNKENSVLVDAEDGIWCMKRTFRSSKRTTYLFFSEKLHRDKMETLERRAAKCVEEYRTVMKKKKDGTLKASDTVIRRLRNPLLELKTAVQSKVMEDDETLYFTAKQELSNGREGFFKLESSENLTEIEALRIYRKRDTAEKLIESLKNHIDMGPLRVWSYDSVRGILTICFLAQMIVSMVRYEHVELSGLSTKTIIRSLEKLTLTVISGEKGRKNRIYSNFEPVNCLVLGVKPPPDTVPGG